VRANHRSLVLLLAPLLACGTPASRGDDGEFGQAGMAGKDEAMVSGKSLELVSWLVQFNRLNSPQKLEAMLNKTPGKFVPVDTDKDGTNDYIAVSEDPTPERDDHALVLHARASASADGEGVLIATLFFNEDWGLTGYTRSMRKAPALSSSAIATAAATAALYSAIDQAAGGAPDENDNDDADPPEADPPEADPPEADPSAVIAVPAGSDEAAGLH
jgi:hypothetical protein